MRTLLMGVLNMTPDSFSDGGLFPTLDAALDAARRLIAEGADFLDIGGESTRPGAEPVPAATELRRVLPLVEALAEDGRARISIDTMKPEVADACLRAGASLINDVTGLRDPRMAEVAARHGAGVVVMHMRGTPATMRGQAQYSDLVAEVKSELAAGLRTAREAGLAEIYVDPGIGFAKTPAHGFELLRRLREFEELGCPILVGPSRKSFLGTLPGMADPAGRLEGTLAATVIAALNGAAVVRVHDVGPCRKALAVVEAVRRS